MSQICDKYQNLMNWLMPFKGLEGANDILVLFIYVQKPPFNAHAEISRGARCFISGMNLQYLVYWRSDDW